MKRLSSLFLVSLLSGATTLGAYKLFIEGKHLGFEKYQKYTKIDVRKLGERCQIFGCVMCQLFILVYSFLYRETTGVVEDDDVGV